MYPPAHWTVPGADELIPAGQMDIWICEGVVGYLLPEVALAKMFPVKLSHSE